MGNEMGNTNVSGFKSAEDEEEEPKIEAQGAAYDDDAGTDDQIHQALPFPSSVAKDSDETLQVLSSSDDDAFGRNEETTLCARDQDSNESPQVLSTDDDPFGVHKETPSCARDSQTEEGKISQLASDTEHETDEVENASGEAQNEGELLFKTEPENLSEPENIVSIVKDENLSTEEDDQDQPTTNSSEKLESLAPENIVSIVKEDEDEDENLPTIKEDDQDQPTTNSSEKFESLAPENIVSIVKEDEDEDVDEDDNLSTKEDDQDQPTTNSSEKFESLAPENIVSIVKEDEDEDENLSTKEDDQDQPATNSSEKLESSLTSSQNHHQLDCEISNEQLIPEITLTTEENESESESSIFSNHETIQTGNESSDNTINDHSLVVDFTFDPPEEEKSILAPIVEKFEATEVQDDQIPQSEDNEKEDMAAGAHEAVAMLGEDTTRLSVESISENPCLQIELTKSPSFGFGFSIEPRIEESDQTPLLCHGRGAATETEEEVTKRSMSRCDEQEKIQVEEEIKTIEMEKSDDYSEKSRGQFMSFLREEGDKVQMEKQDGSLMGKKEPACIDIALASSKSGSWKNKMKHSFFSSCICCAAAAASTN